MEKRFEELGDDDDVLSEDDDGESIGDMLLGKAEDNDQIHNEPSFDGDNDEDAYFSAPE